MAVEFLCIGDNGCGCGGCFEELRTPVRPQLIANGAPREVLAGQKEICLLALDKILEAPVSTPIVHARDA